MLQAGIAVKVQSFTGFSLIYAANIVQLVLLNSGFRDTTATILRSFMQLIKRSMIIRHCCFCNW